MRSFPGIDLFFRHEAIVLRGFPARDLSARDPQHFQVQHPNPQVQSNPVSHLHLPGTLGGSPVERHFAPLAGFLGQGAAAEDADSVQKHVHSHYLDQVLISTYAESRIPVIHVS